VNWHLRFMMALLCVVSVNAGETAPTASCDLAGEWTRDDHVQRVELYQADARWFGRLVSSTEKDAKPGFIMFRAFAYDEQKRVFKGTVVVPSSGMQASADLLCVGDRKIKVTAHKFFMTKSFEFSREDAR
jgi:hypothetical protein